MGLIRGLLTAPIVGPARAGWWVMEQIVGTAEAELYDEGAIVTQIRVLAAEADAGRISEEDHAAAESELLARLVEARRRRTDANEEPS